MQGQIFWHSRKENHITICLPERIGSLHCCNWSDSSDLNTHKATTFRNVMPGESCRPRCIPPCQQDCDIINDKGLWKVWKTHLASHSEQQLRIQSELLAIDKKCVEFARVLLLVLISCIHADHLVSITFHQSIHLLSSSILYIYSCKHVNFHSWCFSISSVAHVALCQAIRLVRSCSTGTMPGEQLRCSRHLSTEKHDETTVTSTESTTPRLSDWEQNRPFEETELEWLQLPPLRRTKLKNELKNERKSRKVLEIWKMKAELRKKDEERMWIDHRSNIITPP